MKVKSVSLISRTAEDVDTMKVLLQKLRWEEQWFNVWLAIVVRVQKSKDRM